MRAENIAVHVSRQLEGRASSGSGLERELAYFQSALSQFAGFLLILKLTWPSFSKQFWQDP
jgi:hypothetical protein